MSENSVGSLVDEDGRVHHLLKIAMQTGDTVAAMTAEKFNILSDVNNRYFDGKVGIECFDGSPESVSDAVEEAVQCTPQPVNF